MTEAPAQLHPSRTQRQAAEASRSFLAYAAWVRGLVPAIDEHWAIIERLLYGGPRELILGATGIGKSQWVAAWLEWHFGLNPNLRVLYVSEIESGIATDVLTEVRETIGSNERYVMTFGDLKGDSTKWGVKGFQFRNLITQEQADRNRRITPTPAPPFEWLSPRGRVPGLRGDNGKPVGWRTGFTGQRIDLMVGDDLVSDKSAYSPVLTTRAWNVLHQKAIPRADDAATFRVILLGQTWAPRDMYGMVREKGIVVLDNNPGREGLDVLGHGEEAA
jgi:hypothetical protein